MVSQVPPSYNLRTPLGYFLQIISGDKNSTKLPSSSPASCPNKQPYARWIFSCIVA